MIRLIAIVIVLLASPVSAQVYFSAPPVQLSTTNAPYANDFMTNWAREISDGETAFDNFQTAITALSGGGIPIPSHAVVAFNLASCPSGWTSFAALNVGRFPRITGGSPAVGTTQGFAMLDHSHLVPETGVNSFIGAASQFFNPGPITPIFPNVSQGVGGMVTGNAAAETRPSNVSQTYCEKN